MATIEKAIDTKVRATAAITAYIGTTTSARIYWIKAPAGTVTLPYITYFTVSRQNEAPEFNHEGSQTRVQMSIWHNHKTNGQELAQAVVDAFDQFSGTMSTFDVAFTTVTGPVQLIDPDHDLLYQFVVDINLNYRR